MLKRLLNNIQHDIKGNYSFIVRNAGRVKALAYLSRTSFSLCKAVILNKKKMFHNIEFYDIW